MKIFATNLDSMEENINQALKQLKTEPNQYKILNLVSEILNLNDAYNFITGQSHSSLDKMYGLFGIEQPKSGCSMTGFNTSLLAAG